MFYFYAIIITIIILDQTTKFIIQRSLVLNQSIRIMPGVLSFTYINNPGAAFGILQYKTLLLIMLTMALFALVFVFRKRIFQYPLSFRLGLALSLGGASGNFIDRLRTGWVIDFLDLEFWPFKNFPVFNLADSAIFIGVLIIIRYFIQLEN